MKKRCPWVPDNNLMYQKYHDTEWGVPLYRDRKIFEFLVLESFQAGLSWEIILRKRGNFNKAFEGFDYKKVAKFTKRDLSRLLKDEGIIRNRAKIEAAINNAKRFIEVRDEFGTFSKYAWQFVGGSPIMHKLKTMNDYPQYIDEAQGWAKDLKKRGFKFLGPTTIYAHMQATGMVNDHIIPCLRYSEVAKLAK
ncbi:MAG: DNA-3-methyladenine glycosylase I [Candidatus Spechtbacterales bacterium]|nr:DNA-3-methyladenine glycosylase I [Candidatus Spechtbacterales bacterium]